MIPPQVLTLSEVAAIPGLPDRSTLWRWVKAGKLPHREMLKGSRRVVYLTHEDVALVRRLSERTPAMAGVSFDDLLAEWHQGQASGLLSQRGRPMTPAAIASHENGLRRLFRVLNLAPEVRHVTAENLKRAIFALTPDYEARRCFYSQKSQMKKGVVSFLRFLVSKGLANPHQVAACQAIKFPRIYAESRKSLTPETLSLLIDKATCRPGRAMDAALNKTLILLYVTTGLRRQELIDLALDDVDLNGRELVVRDGKGHKTRRVGLGPDAVAALTEWLTRWRPHVASPLIFVQPNGKPYTGSLIYYRINRLAKAVGVKIDVHGLRRTNATLLDEAGVSLSTISTHLGHSSTRTTERSYIMEANRRAVSKLQTFRLPTPASSASPAMAGEPTAPPPPTPRPSAWGDMPLL